ncbi:MAG: TonB-dependent receptor [Bacteroidetes bacterium]|nr:TonB-dependent receptor [Bacteroidota bacterium]
MKIKLLTLLMVFSSGIFAQNLTQTIRGTVTDKQTLQPIIGARVVVLDSDPLIGSVTNIEGQFRLEGVPVGRQTIQITYMGYEPVVMQNLAVTSKEMVLNITMIEAVNSLNEVEVTAEKKGETINKMANVSIRSFSVEESNRFAGSRNDVARMAQNYAGVQGADDSRNDIVIRGNSPTGVLFRMEGIDIPNPNHFARFGTTGGPISILNNNVLANSDFMTGAFPSEYGNATAGVFDLKMRTGNNEHHEFMFQFGFNGAELMAEGPFSDSSKASYLLSYRYSTLFLFDLLGVNVGTTALPTYQDLSFKLNFPSKNGVTSIFGIGGVSAVSLKAEDADSSDLFTLDYSNTLFKSQVGVVGITHRQRLGKTAFLNISAGYQSSLNYIVNDTVDLNFENPFRTYASNSVISKQTSDIYYNKKISAKQSFKIGLHNDIYFLNLNDSVYQSDNNSFEILRSYKGNTFLIQPYAQYQLRPNQRITLNLGIHSQTLTLNNETIIEPRAGMSWNLSEKDRISFGYGLHSQMQPIEMYFRQEEVNGEQTLPNKNIRFNKSHHGVISYQHSFRYGIQAKVEAYYQYLYDVPVKADSSTFSILNFGADFNTALPEDLVNNGKGRNYGAELTLEKFLDKGFYFLITTSVYQSRYTASDGKEYNTAFNGNFTFNSLIGYEWRFKPGEKRQSSMTFDVKYTLNGGKRYTEILVAESQLYGAEIRDWENAFAMRYPNYTRGDFRVAFKMVGTKITQEWALDIQNITNYRNIFWTQYNVNSGQIETTYQTGFLPIGQYRIYF